MTAPVNLDGAYWGKTSAPPETREAERVECRRCGSDLTGRLERRYMRESRRWPYRELVEVFLCPCRNGTRQHVKREVGR